MQYDREWSTADNICGKDMMFSVAISAWECEIVDGETRYIPVTDEMAKEIMFATYWNMNNKGGE